MEQHFRLNCCTFTLTIYQLNSTTTSNDSERMLQRMSLFSKLPE